MMNNLLSGRTWLDSRNCETDLSLVQLFHFGSMVMPFVQCVPVVLCAGKYRSNVEVNCRSPSSAVAENAWKYTSTAK